LEEIPFPFIFERVLFYNMRGGGRVKVIYKVKAHCILGEYVETVEVMDNREGKFGVIEEGSVRGSYHIYVMREGDIQESRVRLKEKLRAYAEYECKKAKSSLKSIKSHSLKSEIGIKERRGRV
jgi:hypothetical protein